MSKFIKCELVDFMGTDLTVVNAARVSYAAESKEFSERDAALLKFLAEHNHITPMRHPKVQIRCDSPIFLARQVGKHQVGFDWNEISRRYKDGDAVEVTCYIPDVILARPKSLMKDSAVTASAELTQWAIAEIKRSYSNSVDDYLALIGAGVAPEQARMVLPQGMQTQWIWTGSLFGWANLYNQRSSEHAQYEANLFAEEVNKIMSELFPISWAALTNQ